MTGFEFDTGTTPGTNRSAPVTDCPSCQGDRFVPVDPEDPHGAYIRCPTCNAPTRPEVKLESWWKE